MREKRKFIDSHYILSLCRQAMPILLSVFILWSCEKQDAETGVNANTEGEETAPGSRETGNDSAGSEIFREDDGGNGTTADQVPSEQLLSPNQQRLREIAQTFEFRPMPVVAARHPHFGLLTINVDLNESEQRLADELSELGFWRNQDFASMSQERLADAEILGADTITIASLGNKRYGAGTRLSSTNKDYYADIVVYHDNTLTRLLSIRLVEIGSK